MIVFITGAVVMILEIVGSRILAPYLGTSIYVWTSLIGIILGSLSLGYHLGGKKADAGANYKTFSRLILIAALLLAVTTILQRPILDALETNVRDLRLAALLAALVLFAPASVMLGMVSPYAVRLAMNSVEESGSTVGNLYAISTVGSIFGTFLAGFFLISFFGSINILRLLVVVLLFTSWFANSKAWKEFALPVVVAGSLLWGLNTLFGSAPNGRIDVDTQYNRIWIFDTVDKITQQPIKVMQTDNMPSSAIFLKNDDLVFSYTRFYRIVQCFQPRPIRALVIGGGAYSYPRDFLREFPESYLDVVELDPGQTELAKRYFRLEPNPRLTIYHEDGRTFLNSRKKKYDAIFLDAFRSLYSLPQHLTTKEAVSRLYDALNPDGVLLTNVISSIEGESGRFFRAEYFTYKAIFPLVMIFPVQFPKQPGRSQNVVLLALKNGSGSESYCQKPELAGYLQQEWKGKIETDTPILTDDFAPVDHYIAAVIQAAR